MAELGRIAEFGNGEPVDYAAAKSWYEKAAAGGSASGMAGLGGLYLSGMGVRENKKLAREWLTKAAKLGLHDAKRSLDFMSSK